MYLVKMNYYADKKFNRPEFFVTEEQLDQLIELRNDDNTKDKLITIEGTGYWFAPKDILAIDELDEGSAWWQHEAPDYYWNNLKKEGHNKKRNT